MISITCSSERSISVFQQRLACVIRDNIWNRHYVLDRNIVLSLPKIQQWSLNALNHAHCFIFHLLLLVRLGPNTSFSSMEENLQTWIPSGTLGTLIKSIWSQLRLTIERPMSAALLNLPKMSFETVIKLKDLSFSYHWLRKILYSMTMPCISVKVNRCFKGTCCLYNAGLRVGQARPTITHALLADWFLKPENFPSERRLTFTELRGFIFQKTVLWQWNYSNRG
jgi:hypothetical protein